MIKLKHVEILKYKSFNEPQSIDIEDDITVLVGMNESGKTAILECIAKTNYFENDPKFQFVSKNDYPRKEVKKAQKDSDILQAVICTYQLSDEVIKNIEETIGEGSWTGNCEIKIISKYDKEVSNIGGCDIDFEAFLSHMSLSDLNTDIKEQLKNVSNIDQFKKVLEDYPDNAENLKKLEKYITDKQQAWLPFIRAYVYDNFIKNHLPKFIYYDEYYQLPSRVKLEDFLNEEVELSDSLKTAKALIDLASIDIENLTQPDSFEVSKTELESTSALISEELFNFWTTNPDLNIHLDIDKKEDVTSRHISGREITDVNIVDHILDIRVSNSKTKVSLPLQNSSKGFNWFFSFLVWFEKIQEDPNSNYILLLDEPGLNLHATAQADLLRFLEKTKDEYQIIYTTHSPFMVETTKLNRVRTVFSDSKSSTVTDSIQQKDPNTLFPLQAALGYDIAQNLFISPKNLLVEGASDLLYLTVISEYLNSKNGTGLNEDITIVPVGGLDKVTSFISLLRGSKLSIFCLLDTFTDQKSKSKLEDLKGHQIIKDKNIRFFDYYLEGRKKADIEDIFEVEEYLELFNNAEFKPKYPTIKIEDLDQKCEGILSQINRFLKQNRFNHYTPANTFMKTQYVEKLSEATLSRFEKIFSDVNTALK